MSAERSLCFSFICQSGELELKALLLAASLRYYNPNLQAELVAAVPDESLWGEVSASTKALLNQLAVRVEPITSPFGNEYPIGNKFSALAVTTNADVTVFLDSDILCLRAFNEQDLAANGLLAKPADFNTFSYDHAQWQQAYNLCGMPLPEERVLSTVSQELMLPYFNAGVIAVADGAKFSECWLKTARAVDADEKISNKRPWLDQITLPIAAKQLGYQTACLTEAYNFPAHVRSLDVDRLPALCHYHWPSIVEQEQALSNLVIQLAGQYPDIRTLLNKFPEWAGVSARAEKSSTEGAGQRLPGQNQRSLDFLITGLPRSGTSLLCSLLDNINDVVVINEPQEIFAALSSPAPAVNLGCYYRQMRTDIILGRTLHNKVDNQGRIIEDTRLLDERRSYQPAVNSPTFLLGTKNPLAYLARLRQLCDDRPDLPKIATIRHPVDTIASWKKSFPHLENIDLDAFPFQGDYDVFIDAFQRRSLLQIRSQDSVIVRRALMWCYLTELIWRDRKQLVVIRYEDLQTDPATTLATVTSSLGLNTPKIDLSKQIRPSSKNLDMEASEISMIEMLCSESMNKWGYV